MSMAYMKINSDQSAYDWAKEFQTSQRLGPSMSMTWNNYRFFFIKDTLLLSKCSQAILNAYQDVKVSLTTFMMYSRDSITAIERTLQQKKKKRTDK